MIDSSTKVSNGKASVQRLSSTKTNLLNPNEVTFCVDDTSSNGTTKVLQKRKFDDSAETDSIASSTATSISTTNKKKHVIPDGGFGWWVVGASFFVSLIADGISFSFGLIYTELLKNFDTSPTKLAWVGSFFLAVPLLSGPILSNLVDKYGCRKMTLIGGVIGCLGFFSAAFSNSVELLYLTYGVLAGVGLGVGYVTAVVSIAFWFDKKRTFATGIGAAGTGMGTFIFAPITQFLIDTYGWRGATLILSGVLLNMCVCGALMRDPDWLIEENQLESRSESVQTFSPQASTLCLDEIKKLLETGAPKSEILDTLVTNCNTEANQKIHDNSDIIGTKKYLSEMLLPTFLTSEKDIVFDRAPSRRSLRQQFILNEQTPPSVLPNIVQKQKCALASTETLDTWEKIPSVEDFDVQNESNPSSFASLLTLDENVLSKPTAVNYGSRYSLDETLILKPLLRLKEDLERNIRGVSLDAVRENEIFHRKSQELPTIVINVPKLKKVHKKTGGLKSKPSLKYPNYFHNMRVHRNSIHYRTAMLNTHRYRLRASSCPNIYRNSMTTIAKEEDEMWYDNFLDIIKSIFDFSLFTDFKFAMMSLSTFVLFVWFIIPYFYITEHMLKFGYKEEDSAMLISVIGIFNTIGMIGFGWIGDRGVDIPRLYGHCLVACGVSVVLMPVFVSSYTALVILCTIFGLTFASSFSFTPIILVRLISLEDFTVAYGLILLVQGVGNLLGPPLAGVIYDITNRWDDTFYVAGVCISISGFLAYAIGTLNANDEDSESEE